MAGWGSGVGRSVIGNEGLLSNVTGICGSDGNPEAGEDRAWPQLSQKMSDGWMGEPQLGHCPPAAGCGAGGAPQFCGAAGDDGQLDGADGAFQLAAGGGDQLGADGDEGGGV
jgi:hypothetical protein